MFLAHASWSLSPLGGLWLLSGLPDRCAASACLCFHSPCTARCICTGDDHLNHTRTASDHSCPNVVATKSLAPFVGPATKRIAISPAVTHVPPPDSQAVGTHRKASAEFVNLSCNGLIAFIKTA